YPDDEDSMAAKKTAAKTATPAKPAAKRAGATERDEKTRAKIERLATATLRTVQKGANPALEIRMRALSNVSFNEKRGLIELGDRTQSREFFNTAMARKFMQTFLVAN